MNENLRTTRGMNDCFRTCLAILLNEPKKDIIPLFLDDDWAVKYREWLHTERQRGLLIIPILPNSFLEIMDYLLVHESPGFILHVATKTGRDHAVVVNASQGDVQLLDPSYDKKFSCDELRSLIPFFSKRYKCPETGFWYISIITGNK